MASRGPMAPIREATAKKDKAPQRLLEEYSLTLDPVFHWKQTVRSWINHDDSGNPISYSKRAASEFIEWIARNKKISKDTFKRCKGFVGLKEMTELVETRVIGEKFEAGTDATAIQEIDVGVDVHMKIGVLGLTVDKGINNKAFAVLTTAFFLLASMQMGCRSEDFRHSTLHMFKCIDEKVYNEETIMVLSIFTRKSKNSPVRRVARARPRRP